MKRTWYFRIGLVIALVTPLITTSGCAVLDVIAQQELFDARYLVLSRPSGGLSRYSFSIDYGMGGCQPFSLTESELIDMLNTGAIPGTPLTNFAPQMFEPCEAEGVIRYEANELAEILRDSNGNVTSIERPRNLVAKIVDVDFSNGGVMSVLVYGISLTANTVSRSAAPGDMEFFTAILPSGVVGESGRDFVSSVVRPLFSDAQIAAVATNPNRFALDFFVAAKQEQVADELLLLWSNDIVLRTDI